MNSVERVKATCKKRKIPISKLESDLGFSNGYIGQLRKGVFPADRLAKIANYLEVTTDYLLTGEETKKAPDLTEKDERDIARMVEKIMSGLDTSGDLNLDGYPMSDAAKAAMASAMKIGLGEARRLNKETYTPKKYKKG